MMREMNSPFQLIGLSLFFIPYTSATTTQQVGELEYFTESQSTGHKTVFEGDTLRSEPNQTIKITFIDQSEIWLTPNSELVVTQFKKGPQDNDERFGLNHGLIRAKIQKNPIGTNRVMIQTRTATMGVRGTDFVVELDQAATVHLNTLEGQVILGKTPQDLQNDKTSTLVPAGHASELTQKDRVPSPAKTFDQEAFVAKLAKVSPSLGHSVKNSFHHQKPEPVTQKTDKPNGKKRKKH